MTMVVRGKPLTTPVWQARERYRRGAYGEEIVRTYRTLYSTKDATMPAHNSAHPTRPLLKLKEAEAEQIGSADLCDVRLTYQQDEPAASEPVPKDEVSESGSTVEVDIRQHPQFAAEFASHWDSDKLQFQPSAPAYLQGVTKYVVGTGQVAITTFSRSRPDTVQASLGKKLNPGHGLGQEGHWLVITGGVNKRGSWWARTLVYQYSATVVPDEIYNYTP